MRRSRVPSIARGERAGLGLACCLALCAAGCATARGGGWNTCVARGIEGRFILCDDRVFAQLDCLGGGDDGCKAVTIRVPGRPTQLYCAPGYSLDKPADDFTRNAVRFFLELSPDETQIWFKGGGFFGRSWQAWQPSSDTISGPDGDKPWSRRELKPGDTQPLCAG